MEAKGVEVIVLDVVRPDRSATNPQLPQLPSPGTQPDVKARLRPHGNAVVAMINMLLSKAFSQPNSVRVFWL